MSAEILHIRIRCNDLIIHYNFNLDISVLRAHIDYKRFEVWNLLGFVATELNWNRYIRELISSFNIFWIQLALILDYWMQLSLALSYIKQDMPWQFISSVKKLKSKSFKIDLCGTRLPKSDH